MSRQSHFHLTEAASIGVAQYRCAGKRAEHLGKRREKRNIVSLRQANCMWETRTNEEKIRWPLLGLAQDALGLKDAVQLALSQNKSVAAWQAAKPYTREASSGFTLRRHAPPFRKQ